jgi:hypothetical protein
MVMEMEVVDVGVWGVAIFIVFLLGVCSCGWLCGGAVAPAVHAPPVDAHILPEYGASLPPPAAAHAEFALIPDGSKN